MAVKIPDKFEGESIKGSLEKFLAGATSPSVVTPVMTNVQPQALISNVANKERYILIPQHNIYIDREISYKGLEWENTHAELGKQGLFMPRIDHFMTHFMNVRSAADSTGILYDGNGGPLQNDEAKDLWDYFSSTTNRPKGICWTWLDAKFEKNRSQMTMFTNHRYQQMGGQGSFNIKIDPYFEKDQTVELEFNPQGLPKRASSSGNYVQGLNIYYWAPRAGKVARFSSNSYWADLYCNLDPTNSNSALGVFACAEGTASP
jgi:hypothetical protein